MEYFRVNRPLFYTLGIIFFLLLFYCLFLAAPKAFPAGTIVKIEEGESLRSVSLNFKNENIIRSRILFEAFVILFGGDKNVKEASYYFESKLPVFEVARRISKGEHHLAPIVVTIPEGFTNTEMADTFKRELPNFNETKFLISTKDLEGYLFPDTYFFMNTDTEVEVLKSLQSNYEKKVAPLRGYISLLKKTEQQIITMASIIEGEAKGDTDRPIISGILWKRLNMGMALQVDVAPETYERKGLPNNPVDNPGLSSILAAIHPEKSAYLYYLHDKNGVIHYARTFIEHKANIQKYLQ